MTSQEVIPDPHRGTGASPGGSRLGGRDDGAGLSGTRLFISTPG